MDQPARPVIRPAEEAIIAAISTWWVCYSFGLISP
jgi:hypothetical protein